MGAVVDAPELPELERKLREADAGVTGGPAPAAGASLVTAPGAPVVDESRQWIEAAQRYGRLVRTAMPRLKDDWTDENLREFGVELAACAKHYGWKFGAVLTHPLARLAAAGWPLAAPLVLPVTMPYVERLLQRIFQGAPPDPAAGSAPAPADTAAKDGAAGSTLPPAVLEKIES